MSSATRSRATTADTSSAVYFQDRILDIPQMQQYTLPFPSVFAISWAASMWHANHPELGGRQTELQPKNPSERNQQKPPGDPVPPPDGSDVLDELLDDPTIYGEELSCPCELWLYPFRCQFPTCECPNVARTEACGIRYDRQGLDYVRVGYRAVAENPQGRFTVDRILPDQLTVQPNGALVCSDGACGAVKQCITAFEVQSVPRPTISQGGGNVPLSSFSIASFIGGSANLTPLPQLEPWTKREIYDIHLFCCDICEEQLNLEVFDADLILTCYRVVYVLAGRAQYGTSFVFAQSDFTFRQFAAILGGNGAKALCMLYHQSATQCFRAFRNYRWTAGMSAILAEEFYRNLAFNNPSGDPDWAQFLNLGDMEITTPTFITDFMNLSDAFGEAHTVGGVARALSALGPNPCCAEDLEKIAATLVQAQVPIMSKVRSLVSYYTEELRAIVEITSVGTFQWKLRQALLAGLRRAGWNDCARELEDRW